MRIIKERTRIMFVEYNPAEKKVLEDLVGTMDNVFAYEDPDDKMIAFPPGMEDAVRKLFPRIKIEDHSKEFWEYAKIQPVEHNAQPRNQLQKDFISFALEQAKNNQKIAGILSPGQGKLEPVSRRIPTPDGYKTMGELQVGDKIFGREGEPITVTAIYEKGVQDIYKITFNDGRYALCGADHLWAVKTYASSPIWKVVKTKDMLEDYKIYDVGKTKDCPNREPYRYKYHIPVLSGPIQYNSKPVPVDPYTLGAFIGNGCCTEYALSLSSGNEFVPNKIAQINGWTCRKQKGSYTYLFYDTKTGKRIITKDYFKGIPSLVGSYSRDKEIPEEYIYNDTNVRWELLQGLMDTDGSIACNEGRFHVTYSSCSKKLLEQIQFILKSLGFNATMMIDKYVNEFHAELIFLMPNSWKKHLFTLPYKADIAQLASDYPDTNQYANHLIIKDIKLVKRERARCIRVDSYDELYVTEDFIVTHNTFMACYIAIAVGYRTLIIAPTSGIKAQWAETLTGMFKVDPSRVKVVNSPKDFINVKSDFVICSQASLAVLNKTYDLERIMKANKFGIKVIDEVQMWFKNIINVDANSNICFNIYLTGTFGRSGKEENDLYQHMFGDLAIFREKDKKPTIFNPKPGNVYGMKPHMHVYMMWGDSHLSKEQIKKVSSSMRYSERAGKWMRYGVSVPAYQELIVPSDGTVTPFLRDILKVIKDAQHHINYGRTLILGGTINSAEIVAQHVRKMFPNLKVGTYHSRNDKATNNKNKLECDVLVSTVQSAGTGFDMKDLSRLVVFHSYQSWILTDQISGRLRRRPDGKDTYMWDIVDARIPQLRAWANNRADVLRKKSKTFKVIDL